MKRLAAQLGITYFTVLSIAFYVSDTVVIIIAAASAAAFISFMLIRKCRKTVYIPLMAAAALAACIVNLGYSYLFVYPVVDRYSGAEHTVTAVLKDEPYRSYQKNYYRLRAVEIDGEPASADILVKSRSFIEADPDDKIMFTSELSETENDYFRSKGYYLLSDSYYGKFKTEKAQSHTLYYYAVQLRKRLREGLEELLPVSSAALCRAVFIGDKYAMSLNDRDNFRYAGASYFIVVSGLHFAVLSFIVFRLFRKLLNRYLAFGVMAGFILIYTAVTGFQPSAVRSAVMVSVTVLGATIRRQGYPLNHLGIAGIVMPLLLTPYCAGDIGLILSFYATLAILLWAGPISGKLCFKDRYGKIYMFRFKPAVNRLRSAVSGDKTLPLSSDEPEERHVFLKKLWNSAASVLSVSLAANMLVFPISVFVFNEFSLVTLLSSILLYIPIYLILVLSMLVCVLFWLGPLKYIAMILSWPLYFLCEYVSSVVGFLAGLPFSFIRVGSLFIYIWLAVTILLGAAVIALKKRCRLLPFAVLLSAIVFLAGWLVSTAVEMNIFILEVYSCGDGLYAAVNDKGKLHLLSADCKNKPAFEITEKLLYHSGGAETAFCRDFSEIDDYNYYSNNEFAISRFLLYDYSSIGEYLGDNIVSFNTDSTFILDDDLQMSVSVETGSPVCYLKAGDKEILMIPENTKLKDIPSGFRSPDVIILTGYFNGAEQLSCTDLIISASADKAAKIAEKTEDICENIYYTCGGDIIYDLR